MNERVFSETPGSPRLPSASFARVDQGSIQVQDLPSVLARPRRAGKATELRRRGPVVQVSRELAVLDAAEVSSLRAALVRRLEAELAPAIPDLTGVRAVVARHSLVSFHREELAP